MHRSRLAGFIIDTETGELGPAAEFWSKALGMPYRHPDGTDEGPYRELDSRARDMHVEVQRVDHPSRVHLDIESDDIEAEVRRLEALGAKRVQQYPRWWVLEAPTGHRFCVVRVQNAAAFERAANRWE
jgi:hypothetical protein